MKIIEPLISKVEKKEQLTFEDKVLVNNVRAYLYGKNGLTIYDEPQKIINEKEGTYLVITHHGKYPSNKEY